MLCTGEYTTSLVPLYISEKNKKQFTYLKTKKLWKQDKKKH